MENKERERVLLRILKSSFINSIIVISSGLSFVFLCKYILGLLYNFITFGG